MFLREACRTMVKEPSSAGLETRIVTNGLVLQSQCLIICEEYQRRNIQNSADGLYLTPSKDRAIKKKQNVDSNVGH